LKEQLLILTDSWSLLRFNEPLKILSKLACQQKQNVWLAGGTVRDLLLGQIPTDLDLAVSGNSLDLGQSLASTLGGHFIPIKETLATCRVTIINNSRKIHLDLVSLRAKNIEDDLKARDFTINALAIPLTELLAERNILLDPTGGQTDLAANFLRPTGEKVLNEDPLRVIRGFRFISTHGLQPAPGTITKLTAAAPGIFRLARERIAEEWRKLMAGPNAAAAIVVMEQAQVLTRLIPELALGRNITQNPYHHLNVLEHNLACLTILEKLYTILSNNLKKIAPNLKTYLKKNNLIILKTAALWHDLGKPNSKFTKTLGCYNFYCHDIMGAKLAWNAAQRLGLNKTETKKISEIIQKHMRLFHLLGNFNKGKLTFRAIYRLFLATGLNLTGLFLLGLADIIAGRGSQRPPDAEAKFIKFWESIIQLQKNKLTLSILAPPILNGKILMRRLRLTPGAKIGNLLKAIRHSQLNGKINNIKQALTLANQLQKNQKNSQLKKHYDQ